MTTEKLKAWLDEWDHPRFDLVPGQPIYFGDCKKLLTLTRLLLEAVEWCGTVSACDYEYMAIARTALAECEGVIS